MFSRSHHPDNALAEKKNSEDLEDKRELQIEAARAAPACCGEGRVWAGPSSSFQALNGGLCPPAPSFPSFAESMEAKIPGDNRATLPPTPGGHLSRGDGGSCSIPACSPNPAHHNFLAHCRDWCGHHWLRHLLHPLRNAPVL